EEFAPRPCLLEALPSPEEIMDALLLVGAPRPGGGGNRQVQRQPWVRQQSLDHRRFAAAARPRQDDERPDGDFGFWILDFRLPIIVLGHGRLPGLGPSQIENLKSTIQNYSMFCTSSRTFSSAPLISTTC